MKLLAKDRLRHALLRWLPLVASVAALATAVPLAWSRDFGAFLFTWFLYLPPVFLFCICLGVWAVGEWKSEQGRSARRTLVAILIIVSLAFTVVPRIRDEVRFFVWSRLHGDELKEFADRDAIILDWDGWGIAGMENDSYLVSNPADNLGEPNGDVAWVRNVGADCDLVDTKRLAPGVYIVTTYNCVLR